jgi:hypothetical protein
MGSVRYSKAKLDEMMAEHGVKQEIRWRQHWGFGHLAYTIMLLACVGVGVIGGILYLLFDTNTEMAALLLVSPLLLWWAIGGLKTFRYVNNRRYIQFKGSGLDEMDGWLDRVLEEGGYVFTKTRVPSYKDAFTTYKPRYVYELMGHRTKVTLVGAFFMIIICVGPVRKPDRAEAERLMGSIEGALRRDQEIIIKRAMEREHPEEIDLGGALIGLLS